MNMDLIFIAPGNSVHSFKWISAISKLYIGNIHWVSFYGFDEDIPGVNQIEYKKNIKGVMSAVCFVKKNRKAVIHVHSLGFHLLFLILIRLMLTRNKLITTPWGSDLIYGKENFIKFFMFKIVFKNSALVVCDAVFMKELIEEIYPSARVKLINFGVDTDKFNLIERQFFNKGVFKLLSIRSLESVYNIESIIKMMDVISQQELDVQLSIYADGPLKQKLQKMTVSLNLDDKILFCGRYSQDDLVEILANHDAYISMSRSDAGLSTSTAEAMSTGMICLVSDVAENSLWISNYISGFLIPDNDHQELAKIIGLIATDKIDISNVGKRARKKIVTNYSITREMDKMNSLYRSLGA